jgi:cystathionine beta-lyase/cystathionine gamma-synthase
MTKPYQDQQLMQETIFDLQNDCRELRYLISDATSKIRTYLRGTHKIKKFLQSGTVTTIQTEADYLLGMYAGLDADIWNLQTRLKSEDTWQDTVKHANTVIGQTREILRTNQTMLGSFITGVDWQSPSITHSLCSQAGVQEGTIYATINDYKRDQHWNAQSYEEAFKSNLIDGFIKIPIHAYATASGMAAFTTILSYLVSEGKLSGTVIIGKSLYFECKALITKTPGISVVEVDETDTGMVIQAIELHSPTALFFDSLANMPSIAVADLSTLLTYLISHVNNDTVLVIDNTCQSVHFQPFPKLFGTRSKLSIIVFESLNKYHQYGMDKVTGGIIWTYGGDTGKLFEYRDHLGTNIPDASVAAMPTPNRVLLTKKLHRHGRNAQILADTLSRYLNANPKTHIQAVVYPGLPSHPSYAWTKDSPFNGSYLTLEFAQKYQTIPSYNRLVARVLTIAKSKNINIISGTSFGLNTTRVYVTAVRSKPTTPFVRISAGSEDRGVVESIAGVLVQAVSDFR